MSRKTLLLTDALINFVCGILLIVFPITLVRWMGLPVPMTYFYANILGAVFIGIALALFWEARQGRNSGKGTGLGVVGAAAINLCGGAMLAIWLIAGQLDLTLPGSVFLWLLVVFLVGISTLELFHHRRRSSR